MKHLVDAQHTPGPWCVDEQDGSVWTGVDHRQVAHTLSLPGVGMVHDREERLTNARLIAAAPDLLRHGYALAMLALQSDRYALDPEYRDETANLLAAIAKAQGGTS